MEYDPPDLQGSWTLRRRVADRSTGLVGTVAGELRITVEAGHVAWTETGRFEWTHPGPVPGQWLPRRSAPIRRELRLAPVDGQWWMQFADGRAFHPWRPGRPVDHPCAADHYRGLVQIDLDGRGMRTVWDVTGPTKEQRLITRLTR